jgi:2-dehydropantoate 2-reductase
MRVLVVGAGAIGGYFGGRLLEAGRDVTFLVRPKRAAELASGGLVVRSATGDFTARSPQTLLAENLAQPFDLILLSCKAYDLDSAIASFAPAVGPATTILPLLNGMRHLDVLDQRFGRERVVGGQCYIAATLDARRAIVHLNSDHDLVFGDRGGGNRGGGTSDRVREIAASMQGVKFKPRASGEIVQEMWEKWVFLATLAGSTCLMRAAIGDIVAAPGGRDFVLSLLEECRAIAQANGHSPRDAHLGRYRAALTAEGSTLTASMLRDVEHNAPIEADHIIGDLIQRAGASSTTKPEVPLLHLVYAHLQAYEARRVRG